MSKTEEVRYRFEWDAKNFAGIYSDSSLVSRLFNRTFRKAIFVRYDVAMQESGDPHGKTFLDIGCGSGPYSIELAKRGADRVLGVDFSAPMLEIARSSARDAGVAERTQFELADFTKHDFKGEKFDMSIAMGVFDYLEEPAPFLKKMSEVTRGKIVASFPRFSLVRGNARRLRYRLTNRGDVFYYTEDKLANLVREAGIKQYRLVNVTSSGGGWILVGDNS